MKTMLVSAAFVSAMMVAPAPALAQTTTTITFEGSEVHDGPITRQGFIIGNPVGQEQHFHEIASGTFGLPNNGSVILLNDRDTQISVQSETGALFSLLTVDVAASTGNAPAERLTISGYLDGVLTGTLNVALGSSFLRWNGSALGTFDTLIFDGIDGSGGFVLDNVVLTSATPSAVPEPATWAMMLMGFGAIGYQARAQRKRRKLVRASA